ncbi:hypothetical protein EVAR_89683_1 [Eumeta japonica]|uniref:Uncharacterized protein n=1 Tax=Eumeta variegata TaxID=151549 RepID=A0A4C1X0H4_EUMVA|nr:hypothetical protein EVAR_89683_1 [Eumeta japonica]
MDPRRGPHFIARWFEAAMWANGWNQGQAQTALILGHRDSVLTIFKELGKHPTYKQLMKALEVGYGDGHLKHGYHAKLKVSEEPVVQLCSSGLSSVKNWDTKHINW